MQDPKTRQRDRAPGPGGTQACRKAGARWWAVLGSGSHAAPPGCSGLSLASPSGGDTGREQRDRCDWGGGRAAWGRGQPVLTGAALHCCCHPRGHGLPCAPANLWCCPGYCWDPGVGLAEREGTGSVEVIEVSGDPVALALNARLCPAEGARERVLQSRCPWLGSARPLPLEGRSAGWGPASGFQSPALCLRFPFCEVERLGQPCARG